MCAAILLKRQLKNEKIILLESLDRVGKKLIVTGNGRCNITNKNIVLSAYHGNDVKFCSSALSRYGTDFTKDFFMSLGVPLVEGENGKMYPYSLQASSVVDALRFEMDELGVQVITDTSARKIIPLKNGYKIVCDNFEYDCKNVIVSTGGVVGGTKLGSFGIGYSIMKALGFKLINPSASLVQIKTDIFKIKSLNGIKQNSTVTLYIDGKKQRSETGELLFTRYGISGPPALQISRATAVAVNCKVKINFMPEYTYDEILSFLFERKELLKNRKADCFFNGVFPKMLGHTILKFSDVKLVDNIGEITNKQCRALAEQIYSFTLDVFGNNGYDSAQVTAGGLITDDFDAVSMESLKYKGLYATGEILDIDGDCGGFNLQWAWSSAAAAANDIVGKSK